MICQNLQQNKKAKQKTQPSLQSITYLQGRASCIYTGFDKHLSSLVLQLSSNKDTTAYSNFLIFETWTPPPCTLAYYLPSYPLSKKNNLLHYPPQLFKHLEAYHISKSFFLYGNGSKKLGII